LSDDQGAVEDYTEAIKRDPKDARVYMARSAVYVRMKKYAESLEDRQRAVQLDPKNPEVYVARGGSYHLLGQHEKGFEDRTRAIGLSPSSALGWTARGDAYFLLGRWDEALSDLDQAVKLDPKNTETRQLRAQAQAHVDEKIKEAQAKELAPETGSVQLPAPADVPVKPVTPDPQDAVAAPAPTSPVVETKARPR
jgi:tetratricopeptide (TPR) repeat protein